MSVTHEGTVTRQSVAEGSKSERDAVVLETGQGQLILRRQGGNPFQDPELDGLVGKRIRAEGDEHAGTLIMERWEELQ